MPPLVRFMLMHALVGFVIAFVFVGVILAIDLSGLRTLMLASDVGWVALFMLTFFCGLTFASVQMGLAVMMMDQEQDAPPPGLRLGAKVWRTLMALLTPPSKSALAPIPVQNPPRPRR